MTDQPQHTSGPWSVRGEMQSGNIAIYAQCVFVATALSEKWGYGDEPVHTEAQANARLIAAAPELLEALEKAVRALCDTPSFRTRLPDEDTGRSLTSYQLIPQLERVLREAKGCTS